MSVFLTHVTDSRNFFRILILAYVHEHPFAFPKKKIARGTNSLDTKDLPGPNLRFPRKTRVQTQRTVF